MITCNPVGGISNRLKCLISTLSKYGDDIELVWKVDSSGGGVWCEFNDLFENTFDGLDNRDFGYISDFKFIDDVMNTHTIGSNSKSNLDNELKERYFKSIKKLIPVKYVRDRIEDELDNLPKEFDVFSVRTFKSFDAENHSWGQYFDIKKLYKVLDESKLPFLFMCDDTEIVDDIKNKYSDRIYVTPKRTRYGDFTTKVGMQDILVDLYLGSYSKTIYGTFLSSFCELQWWLGMCKPTYVEMRLHSK